MSSGIIALNQIISMFVIILVGIICYKTKMIDKNSNSVLSAIVLNVVNPALIFNSYQTANDRALAKGLFYTAVLCVVSYIIAIPFSYIVIRKKAPGYMVERMSCIYSNCGFMGIPLVNAVIGSKGVFFVSIYVTVFNILLWTHGVILMSGKTDIKSALKALRSPCLAAVALGLISFFTGIRLPENIGNAVSFIADMNTPLAMIVAGVTIAQTNIISALKKLRIYYVSLIKLIVIPLLVTAVFFFARNIADMDIIKTVIIATACPAGASSTLFAIKYNRDPLYASELFGVTTLFSAVTLPLIISIAGMILEV